MKGSGMSRRKVSLTKGSQGSRHRNNHVWVESQ